MTDIPACLTEIHTALVEKIGGQPKIAPFLRIEQSGDCSIPLFDADDYVTKATGRGKSPDEAIANALAIIAAMPDPEMYARHVWHSKLGKVIDEGHALALPDDVMTPLRASSQAMAKNLLPAPEAAE